MNTTFVISDIHGCLKQFEELLKIIGYDSNIHKLILLGDYVDRGPYSKHVVEKVMKLVSEGAIAIRGNHDQMLIDFIDNNDTLGLNNGGLSTLLSYTGYDVTNWEEVIEAREHITKEHIKHIDFLKNLPLYCETTNHLFVHAGIDPFLSDWKNMVQEDMMWIRDVFIYNEHNLNKTVVVGHTPTVNIHNSADICFRNKKIFIDGGICFNYQLNCLQINEDEHGNIEYISHKIKKD